MRYSIETAPGTFAVNLPDVKRHLRIEHDDDNTYLEGLIGTAQNYIESFTNRKLITQTINFYLDAFPGENFIQLPFGQITSVTHVKYYETDDTENTQSNTEYSVDTIDGRIVLDYGEYWPTDTLRPLDAIEIRYVCGWATPDVIPEEIRQAIFFAVSHWYENREPIIVGAGITVSEVPDVFDALLGSHRLFDFSWGYD